MTLAFSLLGGNHRKQTRNQLKRWFQISALVGFHGGGAGWSINCLLKVEVWRISNSHHQGLLQRERPVLNHHQVAGNTISGLTTSKPPHLNPRDQLLSHQQNLQEHHFQAEPHKPVPPVYRNIHSEEPVVLILHLAYLWRMMTAWQAALHFQPRITWLQQYQQEPKWGQAVTPKRGCPGLQAASQVREDSLSPSRKALKDLSSGTVREDPCPPATRIQTSGRCWIGTSPFNLSATRVWIQPFQCLLLLEESHLTDLCDLHILISSVVS